MKTLESMTKNLIPKISPDKIVETIMNRGKIIPLHQPIRAAEVCCPICGGVNGFYIPNDKTWSCANDECLSINAGKDSKVIYQVAKPTMAMFNVPEIFWKARFEDCHQPDDIIANLRRFCQNFSGFLLLAGRSGSGKSYASSACVQEYLKSGESCRFVNVADLYISWLSGRRNGGNDIELIDRFADVQLLVLDDLGTRTPTEGFVDFIYLLLNKRINNRECGTIISTNMTGIEMSEKVGEAIVSRIVSGIVIKFPNKDKRVLSF